MNEVEIAFGKEALQTGSLSQAFFIECSAYLLSLHLCKLLIASFLGWWWWVSFSLFFL